MIRRLVFACIALLACNLLWAQQNKLEIKGTQHDIYLEHTIAPKETFYSVGRMYNISTKELAAFNHLHLEAPLKVGQVLKVPLTATNFFQTKSAADSRAMIPVYHTIEPGETLYRLGENYNKVPVASLKEWNQLSSNEISVGASMIVGFLKVDNVSSALVTADANTQLPKSSEKKTETIAAVIPAVNNATSTLASGPSGDKPPSSEIATTSVSGKSDPGFSGGYFKNLYNQQSANKSQEDKPGLAGVFKSTSGWQDRKYYCFHNQAAAGTVLKITNVATGKIVYAKVLDAIPDIKQNEGLSLILSNAAAAEIGAGENTFSCLVSFGK